MKFTAVFSLSILLLGCPESRASLVPRVSGLAAPVSPLVRPAAAPSAILIAEAQSEGFAPSLPLRREDDGVWAYHGASAADPMSWLDDDSSGETRAWAEAREKIRARLRVEAGRRPADF